MWTIEMDYETGDSFRSERREGEQIGPVWETKQEAQLALAEIKEHYTYYQIINRMGWEYRNMPEYKRRDYEKKAKTKPWYAEMHGCMLLQLKHSDGERKYCSAFWCGYFETLYEARVVAVNEPDSADVFRPE